MISSALPDHRRRGLVSVAFLIGLIILGLVAGGMIKVAVARRSLLRMAEQQLQADFLADSGVDRALARVEANPDYAGENWSIPAEDLGGRGSARVVIKIKPDPTDPANRQIMVVADYLVGTSSPIRQRRTLRLPLHPSTR